MFLLKQNAQQNMMKILEVRDTFITLVDGDGIMDVYIYAQTHQNIYIKYGYVFKNINYTSIKLINKKI